MNVIKLICFLFFIPSFVNSQELSKKEIKYQNIGIEYRITQYTELKKTFNFETECDTSNIKITCLKNMYEHNLSISSNHYDNTYRGYKKRKKLQILIDKETPAKVGLSGCNYKKIYLNTLSGWLLNSTSTNEK